MALFVGLDVSLKMTSICIVKADGLVVWEGKAESEPVALLKALSKWRKSIKLIGIEACPLSEWLYGALVESGLPTVCIRPGTCSDSCHRARTKPIAATRMALPI